MSRVYAGGRSVDKGRAKCCSVPDGVCCEGLDQTGASMICNACDICIYMK